MKVIKPKKSYRLGGTNAYLCETYNNLVLRDIKISYGFAITRNAYKYFINYNNLSPSLDELMGLLDKKDFTNLKEISFKARKIILKAKFPLSLQTYISSAYQHLSNGKELAVAVRSSAATETLCNESLPVAQRRYG